MAKRIEWRLEPVDEYGDIIDPLYFKREDEARRNIAATLGHFVDAEYVDVCRVERKMTEAEGITEQLYEYRTRHYRNGTHVTLRTINCETPEVVA